MEMWNNYESGKTNEINKQQIQGKPFQFPPDNKLMGFPAKENT